MGSRELKGEVVDSFLELGCHRGAAAVEVKITQITVSCWFGNIKIREEGIDKHLLIEAIGIS